MTIIGITGKKGSGKDTVGELLAKEFGKQYVCERLAFADEVKQELANLTGGSIKHINAHKSNPWLRKLLQFLGTEVGRAENGNMWIEKLNNKINILKKEETETRKVLVYITDVRFVNEAGYVKDKGGLIIKVERKSLENNDPHPSEVEQDRIHPDFTVDNNSGLTRLGFEVKCVAAFIRERIKLQ